MVLDSQQCPPRPVMSPAEDIPVIDLRHTINIPDLIISKGRDYYVQKRECIMTHNASIPVDFTGEYRTSMRQDVQVNCTVNGFTVEAFLLFHGIFIWTCEDGLCVKSKFKADPDHFTLVIHNSPPKPKTSPKKNSKKQM